MTANGTGETNEEATVHINDLETFVRVKFVDDCPAVLSLGLLYESMGYFYSWTAGEQPFMIKDGINWRSENHVPIVAVTRQKATPVKAGRRLLANNYSREAQSKTHLPVHHRKASLRWKRVFLLSPTQMAERKQSHAQAPCVYSLS